MSRYYLVSYLIQGDCHTHTVARDKSKLLQDGEVSAEEFKKAIQTNCVGKAYADFPGALRAFVDVMFKSIDVDGKYRVKG